MRQNSLRGSVMTGIRTRSFASGKKDWTKHQIQQGKVGINSQECKGAG